MKKYLIKRKEILSRLSYIQGNKNIIYFPGYSSPVLL